MGFPGGSLVENPHTNAGDTGDLGSVVGSGRSPGEGNGNPPQYSCLEKPHGQRSLVGCSPWGHKESDTHNTQHWFITLYKLHVNNNIFLLCTLQLTTKNSVSICPHSGDPLCSFHLPSPCPSSHRYSVLCLYVFVYA